MFKDRGEVLQDMQLSSWVVYEAANKQRLIFGRAVDSEKICVKFENGEYGWSDGEKAI